MDRWRVIRREAERRVIGEQRFLEFSRLSLDGERCIGKFLFYNRLIIKHSNSTANFFPVTKFSN